MLACMLHADLGRGALCMYMGRPDIQGAPFAYKGGSLYIKGGGLSYIKGGSLYIHGGSLIYKGGSLYIKGALVYKGGSLYIKGGSLVFAALSDGLMSYCLVLSCGVLFLVRVGVCFCVCGEPS